MTIPSERSQDYLPDNFPTLEEFSELRNNQNYIIGVDAGTDDRAILSETRLDENGNMSVTNIANINHGNYEDIVDSEGNIVSRVLFGNYEEFDEVEDNTEQDRISAMSQTISKLESRVNKLEKLLAESIRREKEFYKSVKDKNTNNNAIEDLEL